MLGTTGSDGSSGMAKAEDGLNWEGGMSFVIRVPRWFLRQQSAVQPQMSTYLCTGKRGFKPGPRTVEEMGDDE